MPCLGVAAAVGALGLLGPLPSQDGCFDTILWLNSDYPRTDAAFAAIVDLGFTAVTVSADDDPAVPGRHGLRFYRDQVAGKGILELRDGPWSLRQKAYERSRDPADLQRPNCLADLAR